MPIDYSKWNNIEISDDEDDTHPNVDTPSLFKWRHEARVERGKQKEIDDKQRAAQIKAQALKVKKLQQQVDAATTDEEKAALDASLTTEEKQHAEYLRKEKEIKDKEEQFPRWDVDNISSEKWDKTIINKNASKASTNVDAEAEDVDNLQLFMKKYEKEYKHYGMLSKFTDSQVYLRDHIHLVSPHTASALLLYALDLEMEDKSALAGRILHQTLIINYICEVAKTQKIDPRDACPGFFRRIIQANEAKHEYMDGFHDELAQLKKRVRQRSIVRLKEAQESAELEHHEDLAKEKQERIAQSPGGLDPQEVFESLPRELQECFEVQDLPKLQRTLQQMSIDDAKKYMKMCADSGLWVPADASVLD